MSTDRGRFIGLFSQISDIFTNSFTSEQKDKGHVKHKKELKIFSSKQSTENIVTVNSRSIQKAVNTPAD